jgi:anti-anti-sigma regulatory factor
MLRITRISQAGEATTLKLEGKLLAAWCDELRAACDHGAGGADAGGVRLDLYDVSFVDADGTVLLRELLARSGNGRRVSITRCSTFVAELLHVNQPERA